MLKRRLNIFQLEGFVSSCAHGMGRSAPDRQYIYVNKRPCDNAKVVKLCNEVYHQFNRTQYPMFILNIGLDGQNVDVNVTPDKLQMFIKNENYLLAILKASLLRIYNRIFKSLNVAMSSFHSSEKSAALMMSFCSPTMSSSLSLLNGSSVGERANKLVDLTEGDEEEQVIKAKT